MCERHNFGSPQLSQKRKDTEKCPFVMAESEGFEPSERFPVHTISNRAPSTTQPTLYMLLSFNKKILSQFRRFGKCLQAESQR